MISADFYGLYSLKSYRSLRLTKAKGVRALVPKSTNKPKRKSPYSKWKLKIPISKRITECTSTSSIRFRSLATWSRWQIFLSWIFRFYKGMKTYPITYMLLRQTRTYWTVQLDRYLNSRVIPSLATAINWNHFFFSYTSFAYWAFLFLWPCFNPLMNTTPTKQMATLNRKL